LEEFTVLRGSRRNARPTRRRISALLLASLAGVLPLAAQQPANEGWLRFPDRPRLQFGNWLRVDLRVKTQNDFRIYSPGSVATDDGLHDLNRARVGIQGEFLGQFEYEVERELTDPENPWRDVFLNWQPRREFQIRGGKFKVPFGMEQLTGPTNLNFVYRALISNLIAPGRDRGAVVRGRFFGRGLEYAAGWFLHDGENSINPGRLLVARVFGRPLRLLDRRGFARNVEIGIAATDSPVSTADLTSLRGRTSFRETFFPRYFVQGRRLRLGTELNWEPGPFGIYAEFMHARDQRLGQGLRGNDISDLITRGWYVAGTWLITGEDKYDGINVRKEFLSGGGIGALEFAVRYEAIRFGSAEHPGLPSRSTRAANILSDSNRLVTFGFNWYVNRWVKIQANGIHERLEDPQRSPMFGRTLFWSRVVRIQASI
jgi:phosphate-selective porin OprO/OprP